MRITKAKEAEKKIRDYLSSGNFKPGDRIPTQVELSAILDISYRPLRESINFLIRQGMLTPKGRAGTFLANPKEHSVVEPIKWFFEANNLDLVELITARAVLEGAIIKEACRNRSTKDLLLLQQWIDAQSEKGIHSDQEIEYDKKFHLQLMSSAHNQVLNIVANVILLQFETIYTRNLYPDQDIIRVRDHQDILDAVYDRDEEKAYKLAQMHIMRSLALRSEK